MTSKMNLARRAVISAAAAAALGLSGCGGNIGGGGGDGGDFPTGPVTITVGQAPGGSTDLIARAIAEGLAGELGVAVPVVNQPGANGALATKEVAGQSADGYNLVLLNASLITVTPLAVSEDEAVDLSSLDVLKGLSQDDYVMVASKASGLTSLDDLLDSGERLSFGTAGVGTASQLAQSALLAQAGVEGTTVPFDSGSPALTAVLGDQVQLSTLQLGEAKAQIDADEVTPLVVFSQERNQFLPDVPTSAEEGYDIPVSQFRALAGPAGLPDNVRDVLVEAIDATTASEAYQQFNEANLLTPHEISGEQVVTEWTDLATLYRELVEEYDINLSDNG